MNTYYFTYGLDERFPFVGGWTEIVLPDGMSEWDARNLFRVIHPNRDDLNCLNCADVYTEDVFKKTTVFKEGNYGERCRERIILNRHIM